MTDRSDAVSLFVARQPILTAQEALYGYEILFRSGFQNSFDPGVDLDYASGRALTDTYMSLGVRELTGEHRAFINFTQKRLEEEVPFLFPRDHLVVEILENVEPTPDLVAAVGRLKVAGYTVALDDFEYAPRWEPLLALADIVKVDFLATASTAERAGMVERLRRPGLSFLAEKVETAEDFEEGRGLGYSLFQGYFFAKPKIIQFSDVHTLKLNQLELIKEVNAAEMDFGRVEEILRRDLSLSYKFLRFINSAYFGFRSEVASLRQALRVLGTRGVRTWLSLITLTSLAEDKPKELLVTALVRARFLESLAAMSRWRGRSGELFLLGLFSVLDAILGRPMDSIVGDLGLSADLRDALVGKPNELRRFFEGLLAHEGGEWEGVARLAGDLRVSETDLFTAYWSVIREANEIGRSLAA